MKFHQYLNVVLSRDRFSANFVVQDLPLLHRYPGTGFLAGLQNTDNRTHPEGLVIRTVGGLVV